MGQFINQPDFITHDIKAINASNTIDTTTFLDSSLIYIGSQSGSQTIAVIPAGANNGMGADTLIIDNGSNSENAATNLATTGGSGTGCTVNIDTVDSNGVVTSVSVNQPGKDYSPGDILEITGGTGSGATVQITGLSVNPPTQNQAVVFAAPPQGEWFPVVVDYVLLTGTTVTDLIAGK